MSSFQNVFVKKNLSVDGNTTIIGNLNVSGTTTSTLSENVLIKDNFMLLNGEYTSNTGQSAGIAINYKPIGTAVALTGTTTPNVLTVAANTFGVLTAQDYILITGTAAGAYDGVYEVKTTTGANPTSITIQDGPTVNGIASSATGIPNGTTGTIVPVNMAVLRASSTGIFEVASNNNATNLNTAFQSIVTSGGGGAGTKLSTLELIAADNQLIFDPNDDGKTITIDSDNPAASRIYTLPDVLVDASFVMTAGAQNIVGPKTLVPASATGGALIVTQGSQISGNLVSITATADLIGLNLGGGLTTVTGNATGTNDDILITHASSSQTTGSIFKIAGTTAITALNIATGLSVIDGATPAGDAVSISNTGLTTGSVLKLTGVTDKKSLDVSGGRSIFDAKSAAGLAGTFQSTVTPHATGDLVLITGGVTTDAANAHHALNVDSGNANFGGIVKFSAGTALLPSLVFSSDSDTGFWHSAANTIDASTSGAKRFTISDAGAEVTAGQYIAPDGTVGAPSYTFNGNLTTGLWGNGDTVHTAIAGADVLQLNATNSIVKNILKIEKPMQVDLNAVALTADPAPIVNSITQFNTSGGAFSATLPASALSQGKTYYIYLATAGNTLTVTAAQADTIGGGTDTTYAMNAQYQSFRATCIGTVWVLG